MAERQQARHPSETPAEAPPMDQAPPPPPPPAMASAPGAPPDAPPPPPMEQEQGATVGENVIINGAGYRMGDMLVPTYNWMMIGPNGGNVSLTNADKVSPSFVPQEAGDYKATLVTIDGPATVVIHVAE